MRAPVLWAILELGEEGAKRVSLAPILRSGVEKKTLAESRLPETR